MAQLPIQSLNDQDRICILIIISSPAAVMEEEFQIHLTRKNPDP